LIEKLYLNENLLTGTIPTELGLLRALGKFHLTAGASMLDWNAYYEMLIVPLAVASASLSIEEVALQNNSLTSTIPEALGLLTNLSKLSLNRAMCGLSSANLILFLILSTYIAEDLYLDSNKFTSTIPSAVVSLQHLGMPL
jgi:hypothetical protein